MGNRQSQKADVSAVLDRAAGLDQPGGVAHTRFPALWTLASGDSAQKVEEAERKLAARLHWRFKVKLGAKAPADDMAWMHRLATAQESRAELIVDANQAWDETTSVRCLAELGELGVTLVEQPVPAWNVAAVAQTGGVQACAGCLLESSAGAAAPFTPSRPCGS